RFFGYVNPWGVSEVFQAYYEEDLLYHTSPSTIAWIGSVDLAQVAALYLALYCYSWHGTSISDAYVYSADHPISIPLLVSKLFAKQRAAGIITFNKAAELLWEAPATSRFIYYPGSRLRTASVSDDGPAAHGIPVLH
ncbi:hypothetical protein DEU56DRAFT_898528, partial [Suillus clintonianus]|uniref:uncharacterized protein n=1 Tax=Suillus clintonianus TaxID=1904413 RepID=UPI001B85CA32